MEGVNVDAISDRRAARAKTSIGGGLGGLNNNTQITQNVIKRGFIPEIGVVKVCSANIRQD